MIRVSDIEKRYGSKRVLHGVCVDVPKGGFLLVTGANGTGKTTFLRLLSGLAVPTAGTVEVAAERRELGVVGHEPLLYRQLTARENLTLFASLYRVADISARVQSMLETYGLAAAADDRVASYSRGMTQRLALARAFLHDPTVLVLDEPYTALDTDGAALLDEVLRRLSGQQTVVLSTHDPARVRHLATAELTL